jgi:hypothetical protein
MALYICVYSVSSRNPGKFVELGRESADQFILILHSLVTFAGQQLLRINNGVHDELGKVPAVIVSPRILHKTDCYQSDKSYLIHNVYKEASKTEWFRAEELYS